MVDIPVKGTPYVIDALLAQRCAALGQDVMKMRNVGSLSPEVLSKLRQYFRIKNIYNSNAIEGNQLDVGETRLVVEQGLTISGKPLRDQAEARNLSEALDFLEDLAAHAERPISEADVRQLHGLVLKDIQNADAGVYRHTDVEISGSQYKPPSHSTVPADMQEFGSWLVRASVPGALFGVEEALLAAAVAHTWFVTIHPFVDGNGRTARLLMNLVLMRYGFPIAIITRDDRLRYYDALEISQSSDLTPLLSLVVESAEESMEEYRSAADEQREGEEWAKSIAKQFARKAIVSASNQYEVWKSAMELLKSQIRQIVEMVSSGNEFFTIYFSDFGIIEFEKYASLKNMNSAKRTWFFRVDFKSGAKSVRYLFFFGYPSHTLRSRSDVTVHISREEPPGSFKYERLDALSAPDVPSIFEIGYDPKEEHFLWRSANDRISSGRVDALCRRFLEDVAERNFGG